MRESVARAWPSLAGCFPAAGLEVVDTGASLVMRWCGGGWAARWRQALRGPASPAPAASAVGFAVTCGHGKHRTWGDVQQSLRHAAEQQSGEGGMAPRAQHDDVGVLVTSDVGDRVRSSRRPGLDHLERGPDSVRAELGRLALDLRLELVLVGVDGVAPGAWARGDPL